MLGPGITAEDPNDDCLGRALDWLYVHDPTALFAGIADRARQVFGVHARQLHADTTSFVVSGAYEPEAGDVDAQAIAITYGYSRDHREYLKQWMLGVVTTHDGDVPVGLQALDGNASDQVSLPELVSSVLAQLRAARAEEAASARDGAEATGPDEMPEEAVFVADSGQYSSATMTQFNAARVRWISCVPETSTEAKAAVAEAAQDGQGWQTNADQTLHWSRQQPNLPQGPERWLLVWTQAGLARARAALTRQVTKQQTVWQRALWHLGNHDFACAPDAQTALTRALKDLPAWLHVDSQVVAQPRYVRKGRPRKDVAADRVVWQVQTQLHVDATQVEREALRRPVSWSPPMCWTRRSCRRRRDPRLHPGSGWGWSAALPSSRIRSSWPPRSL